MQKFKVSDLTPHSQNEFFFDNMDGQKWKEFLESVRTSGVIEPPVVTNEGIIVSGHQRIRACKELGIDEIFCEVRIYDDPDRVTKDLIETNVRQRGTINGSELKMGRIIKELERVYGVKKGRPEKLPHSAEIKSQADIAKELGKSVDVMNRLKKLSDLPEEFQEMLESGTINAKTGYTLIAKLSEDEQLALLEKLPAAQKLTLAQVQQYIDQIKGLECEKQELQKEVVDAIKAAKSSNDSAEYMRMKDELEQAKEDERKYYEKWNEEKKKERGIHPDDVETKIEDAVNKTKADYRRLIDSMQKQLDELQDAEPEVVEVEVMPEDYEEIKAELARLKQESRDAHQTDFSRQFKRRAVEERTPEELLIGFEQRLVNETGAFLSVARGLEVEFNMCHNISNVSKSLVRKNIEQLHQILTKMDAAIMGGKTECKSA